MSSVLSEIGPEALTHRDELEEVKRQLNIRHDYFDCWIYGFLENKKFSIEETVSKLQRRAVMESTELAQYVVTDYMKETMRKGIIQLIGDDKEGRVTFYINTKRDHPTAKRREENKRNFDMWLTYGTRLRKENKRCRIAMLINQKDASLWSNTDMTFQADVALRIAKFYPGVVDRMYITKMSNTLSAMAKPIFTRLPAIVSERIRIFSEDDVSNGKLLELFDESVLPVDLGGKNACDGPQNWEAFGNTIEGYFEQLKTAVSERGLSVKEWELENLQKELAANKAASARDRREARNIGQNLVAESSTSGAGGGAGPAARAATRSQRSRSLVSSQHPGGQASVFDERTSLVSLAAGGGGGYGASRTHNPDQQLEDATSMSTVDEHAADNATDFNDDDLQSCFSYDDDDDYYAYLEEGDGDQQRAPSRYADPTTGLEIGLGAQPLNQQSSLLFRNSSVVEPTSPTSALVAPAFTSPRMPTNRRAHAASIITGFVPLSQLPPLVRFFFEEERRWRQHVQLLEAEGRLLLCDAYLDSVYEMNTIQEDVMQGEIVRRWTSLIPSPVRPVINFFLQSMCTLSSVYFLCGTIFCTSVAASIVVTLFLAMLEDPIYAFPVGGAVLLAGFQGGMLCSRGVELTKLMYTGRLLPGFKYAGAYAQVCQLTFTMLLIISQLIIFLVYAVRSDTLTGLQVAFATGWISGTLLIGMHHALFFLHGSEIDQYGGFPVRGKASVEDNDMRGKSSAASSRLSAYSGSASRQKRNRRQQQATGDATLPIYLLFDITEEDDEEEAEYVVDRTSAMLFISVPVFIALALGTSCLVTGGTVEEGILAATIIATLTAAWASNAYVDDVSKNYRSALTIFVVWFSTVVWLFDVFTFSFRDYTSTWGTPVIALSVILCFFLVMAVVVSSKRSGSRNRLVRFSLLCVCAYMFAMLIMSFVVVSWRMGLLFVLFGLHSALCLSRNTHATMNLSGRFFISSASALLLVACVLLGFVGTSFLYDQELNSQLPSLRSVSSATDATLLQQLEGVPFYSFQQQPLCNVTVGYRFLREAVSNGGSTDGSNNATSYLLNLLNNLVTPSNQTHTSILPEPLKALHVGLFAQLAAAATPQPLAADMAAWFPSDSWTTTAFLRPSSLASGSSSDFETFQIATSVDVSLTDVQSFPSGQDPPVVTMHTFLRTSKLDITNTTTNASSFPDGSKVGQFVHEQRIFIFRTTDALQSVRMMSLWAESIALSPLSIFLPRNWIPKVIAPYSFSSFLSAFAYQEALQEASHYVESLFFAANSSSSTNNETSAVVREIALGGTGIGGGFAELLGVRCNAPVVAWNSPGVHSVLQKLGVNTFVKPRPDSTSDGNSFFSNPFSLSTESLEKNVLGVSAEKAALRYVGGAPDRLEELRCNFDTTECQSNVFLLRQLMEQC